MQCTMNATRYVDTLASYLVPSIHLLQQPGQHPVFMHDNAPPHKAKSTMDWLATNNIIALPWPPYSPDINPIENVWGKMKNVIRKELPATLDELEDRCLTIWNGFDSSYSERLVDSMHSRLTNIVVRHGIRC
jgi:transposase